MNTPTTAAEPTFETVFADLQRRCDNNPERFKKYLDAALDSMQAEARLHGFAISRELLLSMIRQGEAGAVRRLAEYMFLAVQVEDGLADAKRLTLLH
jgi:hypothetical protein